jgi:hypothetical protein
MKRTKRQSWNTAQPKAVSQPGIMKRWSNLFPRYKSRYSTGKPRSHTEESGHFWKGRAA